VSYRTQIRGGGGSPSQAFVPPPPPPPRKWSWRLPWSEYNCTILCDLLPVSPHTHRCWATGFPLRREEGWALQCRRSDSAEQSPPRSQSLNSRSQSYFRAGGLPPISSSWCQAPWDRRPEIFQLNSCVNSHLWQEDGFVSYEYAWPLSSVRIALIACYWKFFLLHYIQVLCQYRLYRADHA
jgi:hypothetical protein